MFLATTSLEEFWDINDKIIFLGKWCMLDSRKDFWNKLDYTTIPELASKWQNPEVIDQSIEYCDVVYEKVLSELTNILNNIHKVNYDKQYYRIILGNWLLCFINLTYERYQNLKYAISNFNNVNTFLLDESQFVIPVDCKDFFYYFMNEDHYNLQLFTQIFRFLEVDFICKKSSKPIVQKLELASHKNFKTQLSSFFLKLISFTAILNNKDKITITEPYFKYSPFISYLNLYLKSKSNIIFDNMCYDFNFKFNIDMNLRKFLSLNLNDSEFTQIFSNLIFQNLPVIYLEVFQNFNDFVTSLPIKKSKAFFTLNAINQNNIYKFYIAQNHNKVDNYIMQHGGNYGVEKNKNTENYEKSVSKQFYTWGWEEDNKTLPLAPAEISDFLNIKTLPQSKNICLILTMAGRYHFLFCFGASNYNFSNFITNDFIFLKNLKNDIKKIIRFYPSDLGEWNVKKAFNEAALSFNTDDMTQKFIERLPKYNICVFDHLSTTFLETLALNKPTVIFADPKVYKLRPSAQPYFDMLEKVKILHYSPTSAAEHVNKIYDDVNKWWLCPKVQQTRKIFVNRFARISKNWVKEWAE
ncbi:MAG: hypothetical protein GYA62_11750, partial [Bacteroidales bacterium]|nr:hypothetical protein [Bacteroidales bacterium]